MLVYRYEYFIKYVLYVVLFDELPCWHCKIWQSILWIAFYAVNFINWGSDENENENVNEWRVN